VTHRYQAFGLAIRSNRPLAGLAEAVTTRVDLDVEFAAGRPPAIDPGATATTERTGSGSVSACADGGRLLRFASHGGESAWSMRVSGHGRSIEVRWRGPVPLADIAAFVEVSGISTALSLRGVPLLHGCAVEAGPAAFLALGAGGSGKSTLAAASLAAGHALLSDDVAALEARDRDVYVHPGGSQLRLNGDSAEALGWDPAELSRVFVTPELPRKLFKRLSTADGTLCEGERRVAAMFVLAARGAAVTIEQLTPAAALPLLLRNTFGERAVGATVSARLLPFWTGLARKVPIYAVTPPDRVSALPALVEALVAQCGR
jgi:hypothetical protein